MFRVRSLQRFLLSQASDAKNGTYNLTLSFDDGFGDWNQQYWRIFRYDSSIAK